MITLVVLISFLIIPSANTADSGNTEGGVDLYFTQNTSITIKKEYLPYFETLQTHVNNNEMKQEINPASGYKSFKGLEDQGFDYEALGLSIEILLDLCNSDLQKVAKVNNASSVERIDNCMNYFSQRKKDYLATTLLTAYEVGEFLGASIIIQRAIVNQMYDKISHETEEFDYADFEKYLINPKDFHDNISDRKNGCFINLSKKIIRSANLSYITEQLEQSPDEGSICIDLANNKIRDIKIEALEALQKMAFKKKTQIHLSLLRNPLFPETKKLIEKFKEQSVDKLKIQDLDRDFDLTIKNLRKKVFASLTAISILASLAITQLLKKASPLIALVGYKKLQVGIKLCAYLLPLSGVAYIHFQWLKHRIHDLNLKYGLIKLTTIETNQNYVSITY